MVDSAVIYDEVTNADAKLSPKDNDKIKTIPRNFNEKKPKKAACKTQHFYISLAFLLTTIALLIALTIDYYLIKHVAKQLLPFNYTNNELRYRYKVIDIKAEHTTFSMILSI